MLGRINICTPTPVRRGTRSSHTKTPHNSIYLWSAVDRYLRIGISQAVRLCAFTRILWQQSWRHTGDQHRRCSRLSRFSFFSVRYLLTDLIFIKPPPVFLVTYFVQCTARPNVLARIPGSVARISANTPMNVRLLRQCQNIPTQKISVIHSEFRWKQ